MNKLSNVVSFYLNEIIKHVYSINLPLFFTISYFSFFSLERSKKYHGKFTFCSIFEILFVNYNHNVARYLVIWHVMISNNVEIIINEIFQLRKK